MNHSGRIATCACGSASIELSGAPKIHAVCHCANCRRRTGSAFGWSAYFPREALSASRGDLTEYALRDAARGVDQRRFFCTRCGSTLYWFDDAKFPTLVGVAAGCLVEPLPAPPTLSASHGGKCAWLDLPGEWKTLD
jgi:hypothetical protein